MFKKILTVLACVLLAQSAFLACDKKGNDTANNSGNGDVVKESGDSAQAKDSDNKLKDGKWPAAIYSKYGIDEIPTKGKIVYTELIGEGPYQYQVNYHGVTQDELKAWVDSLIAKGFRIHDRDKERVNNNSYDHDTMIYLANEKQPYRMRLSFDFKNDMEFEYYTDSPNPAFTVTEKGENYYIIYNLSISLNPLKTETEFKGSIDSLGLKAEDLKVNDSVRAVSMSENMNGAALKISFFADHFTTKEDSIACRDLLMDKLAEKGAKFSHALSGKEMTPAELKEAGIGSYMIESNGKKFLLMVDSDSEFNEFGGGYGVRLTLKK